MKAPLCKARHRTGVICTAPSGHEGDHIAEGAPGRIYERWSDRETPDELRAALASERAHADALAEALLELRHGRTQNTEGEADDILRAHSSRRAVAESEGK